MTHIIRCGSCGGSGFFRGTYGDIRCIDCEGEGSWEAEDEKTTSTVTLADLRAGKFGLIDVHPDPLRRVA